MPAARGFFCHVVWVALCVCVIALTPSLLFAQADGEVMYPNEAFAKLDTFEGHSLNKADKVFNQKNYKQSIAEYDAFILEFPKSAALPYALYRKARSLQLNNKRHEAVKQYTELLDYFPNVVAYAAPSSFQIGQCHFDNGDVEKAMIAWAKMADDADYAKHPLAARAINQLAAHLVASKQAAKAMDYYKQVAFDFRTANKAAANTAMEAVIGYYLRTKPDQERLREFYLKVGTFEDKPGDPGKDLATDWRYWYQVRVNVRQYGSFAAEQTTARDAYYKYWIGQLEGKFAGDDEYQIEVANFKMVLDNDQKKWNERIDKQFVDFQKDGNYGRIIRWVQLYAAQKDKVNEYYAKLAFDKMSADEIIRLMWVAYDNVRDPEMGRATFAKVQISKMSDGDKDGKIYQHIIHRDGRVVVDLCMSYENKDYGRLQLLRYYHSRGENTKGLEIAAQLMNVADYAKEVNYKRGEMFQRTNKFDEAMAAYRLSDNPPTNLWRITECFLAQGKVDQAIGQLREIENFFKKDAPAAALRIATIYNDAKQKDKYIAALRGVLKKYPESSESSQAHLKLEAMGITKIGGGQDAD